MSAKSDKRSQDSAELRLQSAWNSIAHGTTMRTSSRKPVTVLFPGNWNFEQGPDFRDAKLIIDGREISGDVEVHHESSDWFAHGHNSDGNYRNVILHVVSRKPEKSGSVPDSLPFPTVYIRPDRSSRFPLTESEKFQNGACVSFFSSANDAQLHDVFTKAGISRFEEKSRALLAEMIDSGSEQACLKHIFEACGYKKNREQFIELYMRFAEHEEIDWKHDVEPILWGESGLMPDPTSARLDPEMKKFVKETWASWWRTRMTSRDNIRWNKSGVRPLNMPERRIAGLAVMLVLFSGKPLKFLSEKAGSGISAGDFAEYLSSDLSISHRLWDRYVNFLRKFSKPSSVIGADRMNDIAANVLLPALHAYSTIRQDAKLGKFALDAWRRLPMPQMNRNVRTAYHRWFMPPQRFRRIICDTASFHGAMHLYARHCRDNTGDCASCSLGNLK